MKRTFLYLSILFILPLIFLGCAQNTGDNPEGDTGGDNGYGVLAPSTTQGGDGGTDALLGTWRHDNGPGDYETATFNSDGTMEYKYYVDYALDDESHGTYSASETDLYIDFISGPSYTVAYAITGSYLTIDWDGDIIEYYLID
jgi:hypothetical protein